MIWDDVDSLESLKVLLFQLEAASVIGVIVGVWYERDHFPKIVQDAGWTILVVSLAVELLFLASLFGIEGRISRIQRSEIIALKKADLPRNLSIDAQQRIVKKLTSFEGTEYDLSTVINFEPGSDIRAELSAVLRESRWKFNPIDDDILPPGHAMKNPLFPDLGLSLGLVGIRIIFDGSNPTLSDASKALSDALNAEGIFSEVVQAGKADWMMKPNAVHITIGSK